MFQLRPLLARIKIKQAQLYVAPLAAGPREVAEEHHRRTAGRAEHSTFRQPGIGIVGLRPGLAPLHGAVASRRQIGDMQTLRHETYLARIRTLRAHHQRHDCRRMDDLARILALAPTGAGTFHQVPESREPIGCQHRTGHPAPREIARHRGIVAHGVPPDPAALLDRLDIFGEFVLRRIARPLHRAQPLRHGRAAQPREPLELGQSIHEADAADIRDEIEDITMPRTTEAMRPAVAGMRVEQREAGRIRTVERALSAPIPRPCRTRELDVPPHHRPDREPRAHRRLALGNTAL